MNSDDQPVRLFPAGLSLGQVALRLALVALAYFAAHQIAFQFPDAERILMTVQPAGGIGLAVLLLSPRRLWPAIIGALFLAGNSANLLAGRPLFNSLGFMTANILESLVCAFMIIRWCGENVRFTSVKEVVSLIFAATVVNACTSLVGAGTAAVAGIAPFWSFWQTWLIAHGLGILIVAPLLITWSTCGGLALRVPKGKLIESGLFMVVWCAAAWLTFHVQTSHSPLFLQPYIFVALLAWPALRLGQRGVTPALALLAVIAVSSSSAGTGPLLWGGDSQIDRALLVQVYLACIAVTGFLLAAGYAECTSARQSASEDQSRLRALGDNLPDGMVYQVVREHDGSMRFHYLSAGIEQINGVSAEEALRDPSALYGLIVEEDSEKVAAAEEKSAGNMTPFNVAARIRHPDGRLRWMHFSSSPRRLVDGRIMWDGIQLDITDRKEADEEINRQKEVWEQTFDALPDLIAILGTDHRILRVNKALADALGLPAEKAVGMACHKVVHGLDSPPAWCPHTKLIADGKSHREEIAEPRLAGTFDFGVVPLRGPNGRLTGAVHILHDITELKRAENALRESEERYRLLAENSLVGVYLHQDTFFVYVNPVVEKSLGYSFDELKKMRFWEIFHPDQREMIKERGLARYRGEMRPHRYESRLVTKAGEVRWIEISAASVQYRGKVATIGTFADVTGRKQAEEALQQSEQRFRAIFNSAAVGIDVLDRSGRFVQVNTALANMLGYTREELFELTPFKLTHPDDLEKSRENLDALVRGKTRTYRLEKRYIRKDGSILVGDVMVSAIYNARGLYESTIGVVSDITQRKQAEEQVKASLKEKEILLQEIHHRVKNNLALVGSLLTLQTGYADETHRRMFDDLEARVRSMALAHEKLYQSESLADLKIGEYVSGLVDHLVATTSLGAPIRLVKEIDEVSFGIDTAIPLGFLLTELVSNSLKHAFPDGREGEIRICLRSISDNEFELVVSDNGVGIPEDIDLSNPVSLGMDLVDAFVHKLKGSSKIVRDNGTQVRIVFKEV